MNSQRLLSKNCPNCGNNIAWINKNLMVCTNEYWCGWGERAEKIYTYHIDTRPYDTEENTVTGSRLMELSELESGWSMFQEFYHGGIQDIMIQSDTIINLDENIPSYFYTVPSTING